MMVRDGQGPTRPLPVALPGESSSSRTRPRRTSHFHPQLSGGDIFASGGRAAIVLAALVAASTAVILLTNVVMDRSIEEVASGVPVFILQAALIGVGAGLAAWFVATVLYPISWLLVRVMRGVTSVVAHLGVFALYGFLIGMVTVSSYFGWAPSQLWWGILGGVFTAIATGYARRRAGNRSWRHDKATPIDVATPERD